MAQDPPPSAMRARRRLDPLGLWLCGLAALGLARAWLYLVRDAGSAGAVGWIWFGGALLLGATGLALLMRGLRAGHRRQD
ncbi:hypothetical protein [Luteimonas sp. MC1750]|uniref:hypothetical protein n=2 Tax=Luteimonas sp. MC1750 TaxID=2799326 RepID=UPI00190DFDAB|nr:hypothetical protein [Luteimonas sp. MC1750]MBJ6983663.1 hypothetical protein [Luteimonas sp. MC1750]QQO06504.1 hypothetical protein JGR68_03395 [Luteimonas sp. MC1750]